MIKRELNPKPATRLDLDAERCLARPVSLAHKRAAATQAAMTGRPGLFSPRLPGLWSTLPGVPKDASAFDTAPLLRTLNRLIDFNRVNTGQDQADRDRDQR